MDQLLVFYHHFVDKLNFIQLKMITKTDRLQAIIVL